MTTDDIRFARFIIDEAKRKHFLRTPCLYCQTMIKPLQTWCKPSCAKNYINIILYNEKTNVAKD